MTQQRLQRQVSLVKIGNPGMPVKVERGGGGGHHRQIHKSGNGHRDSHIPFRGGVALFTRPAMQILG